MLKTKPLVINIVLSLFALALHAYLTQKFFDLQNGAASGESICNVGALWNCDAVSSSSYAQVLGFPLALWAFCVHLVYIAAQVITVLSSDKKSVWAAATSVGSVIVALASVIMLSISLLKLKNYCLFCFVAYGLSFVGLLLVHFSGLSLGSLVSNLKNLIQNKLAWGLVLAVPVSVFVFAKSWGGPFSESRAQMQMQDQILAWKAAPEQNFDLTLGIHMGAPLETAKMTIVEFADFRCPHCKFAAPTLKAFTQGRQDVALIFKPFPLDGTCNPSPSFNGQGDGISCRLAFAAFCADQLEKKGWELTQKIFNSQDDYRLLSRMEDVDSKLCAEGVTSDCEKLKACMSEDNTRVQIQKMAQEGITAQIRGTPSFFINKKELGGAQFLPVLQAAEKALMNQTTH